MSYSDEWINPEEFKLNIHSIERFPLSIHQLFNPDAVHLEMRYTWVHSLILTLAAVYCFSNKLLLLAAISSALAPAISITHKGAFEMSAHFNACLFV